MLQYCLDIFFVGTAFTAIFIIFDSCRKALRDFRLLIHESKVMGPIWAEIGAGISLQSDDPELAEESLVSSCGTGIKRQSAFN